MKTKEIKYTIAPFLMLIFLHVTPGVVPKQTNEG